MRTLGGGSAYRGGLPRGVYREMSAYSGVYLGGSTKSPSPVNRQTGVKTLPSLAVGKNPKHGDVDVLVFLKFELFSCELKESGSSGTTESEV